MLRLFENRDCMEGMKEYPDKFFDLAIVDPPYGIGESYKQRSISAKNDSRWLNRKTNWIDYEIKDWDNGPPPPEYFRGIFRVSKNQIIFGGNHFPLPPTKCWIVWDKKNGNSDFSDCELAWSSFDSAIRKFEWLWAGFRQEKGRETRIHPTQKPVALYRWLLENYAKPGDKILDTHVGSASSLIAFEAGGFEYVGFEIDKDYYQAARKRLETWRSLPLFDEKKAEESNQLDLAI